MRYLGQVVTGDLGTPSGIAARSTDILIQRLPTTIELTLLRAHVRIVVGRAAGHHLRRTGGTPRRTSGTMVVANLGVSIPVFVLGPRARSIVFAVVLKDTSSRCRHQGG